MSDCCARQKTDCVGIDMWGIDMWGKITIYFPIGDNVKMLFENLYFEYLENKLC